MSQETRNGFCITARCVKKKKKKEEEEKEEEKKEYRKATLVTFLVTLAALGALGALWTVSSTVRQRHGLCLFHLSLGQAGRASHIRVLLNAVRRLNQDCAFVGGLFAVGTPGQKVTSNFDIVV